MSSFDAGPSLIATAPKRSRNGAASATALALAPAPVRLGLVGLNFGGHILKELGRGKGGAHVAVAGICDLDQKKAAALARRHGVPCFSGLDALLRDPEVEAVGLFTGPSGRAELIRQIIRAGKDVLTTKPFEVDGDAALAVLKEARRRGRVIHLNSPSAVPSADLRQIEAWRQEHDLGIPVGARADVWASYREKPDGSWYDDPSRCPIAPIFRIGIYHINDLVRLFGPAREVQVIYSRLRTRRPTPDNAQLGIRFRNGALANIFASFCVDDTQEHRNTLVLNFERGTIYRNPPPFPRLRITDERTRLLLVTRDAAGRPRIERRRTATGSGGYNWQAFQQAVRGSGPLESEITPTQIVDGLKIIAAMRRAEASGRTEAV